MSWWRNPLHRHKWRVVWWRGDLWTLCNGCGQLRRIPADDLADMPAGAEFETLDDDLSKLADKPAAPDIISLVRSLRRAVESTSVGDPLKMPEWRALCAAMNEIDAAGSGR